MFERKSDEALARQVVDRLEAAYWRVGNTLGVYPSQPITVVLYTREQFGEITRLAGWSVAGVRRAYSTAGSAARSNEPEELDRVLSHEFVHALVATLGGRNVPAWMNEGLATVLEPAGPADVESTLARTYGAAGAVDAAPGLRRSGDDATPRSHTRRRRVPCAA